MRACPARDVADPGTPPDLTLDPYHMSIPELSAECAACVVVVRAGRRMGLGAVPTRQVKTYMARHFAQFGEVRHVFVSYRRAKAGSDSTRPGCAGLVVMKDAKAAETILETQDQVISEIPVRVQRFLQGGEVAAAGRSDAVPQGSSAAAQANLFIGAPTWALTHFALVSQLQ